MEKLMTNPPILTLYGRLIRNGVHDQYARVILERAGALKDYPLKDGENIREKTIREMMGIIKVKDPFQTKDPHQVVAAFIGTTGVGKTTTIAKLAAQLMLKSKKKVGLISIDNYRIGAMEQLRAYANILGIPCFPAFNRKDLLFALKRLEGRDVILVDTAGQSQYDQLRIEELKKMITSDLDISSHLLLSVPTAEAEMNKTAINFGPIRFQSYVFTKMDEAQRCGSIINQLMKLNLPISYVTNGQNVPEDIERADKGKILSLLLSKN
jgi:flagellar biosynthesis protein FlhF